ncbi:MAG: TylF/MycF/NovP-related O-methyltransferase [Ferruginibacter sp.]
MITYTNFNISEKTFFLFDTFDGLDMNQVSEEELAAGVNRYIDKYKGTLDSVKKTFEGDRVRIIPGIVPDTLPQCTSPQIAFLSIDMNCVAPEISALTYFYPKMVKGGMIVLDDYGFPKHIHQKKAFDRFADENSISILSLPTGQGIIFV